MLTVVEQVMTTEFASIAPDRTVADAISLVMETNASILPVVDGDLLVGVITMRDLLRVPPYRPIAEVMTRDAPTIACDMLLTSACSLMEEQECRQLPVVSGDRIVGLVSSEDVLRAMGKPVDPLTDLPWGSSLRERAVEQLKAGQEIAILFLDLDGFGTVNKQYGHIVGDRCISAIAQALRGIVDPARDLLCRYGGDEFAVLTMRPRTEAEEFGRRAQQAISTVKPAGAPAAIALSASLGIAGGKRTAERHDIHFVATVDSLITAASQQSTRTKMERAGRLPPAAAPSAEAPCRERPRLRLRHVGLSTENGNATATVELSMGSRRFVGQASGPHMGLPPLRLLAESAVQAVNQAMFDGWRAVLDDVHIHHAPPNTLLTVTILLGRPPGRIERHAGCVVTGDDLGQAVAKATLHALNRRLALLLGSEEKDEA